jgi:hypothetical protein
MLYANMNITFKVEHYDRSTRWLLYMVQEAPYRTIRVSYHRFHFKSFRRRIEDLDIEGCLRTVPRQESVSNCSTRHRELFLKTALLVCLICLRAR